MNDCKANETVGSKSIMLQKMYKYGGQKHQLMILPVELNKPCHQKTVINGIYLLSIFKPIRKVRKCTPRVGLTTISIARAFRKYQTFF